MESGADITLIGTEKKKSPEINSGSYKIKRFRLPVKKGFFFYAFYNVRLFLYLLFRKKITLLVSCDLDTLAANYLVSVLRGCTLIYDSHEYFTEVPELQNRKFTRNFWLRLEKFILPKIKYAYTVSESIAKEYNEKYKVEFKVIRNLPIKKTDITLYPLPENLLAKKKILYQGAINVGRGLEQMMEVVKELNDDIVLIIAGEGDLYDQLKRKADSEELKDKIFFTGRIPHEKLAGLTIQADMGISLEEDFGKNYKFALPNKLFDYIQAEIPVLVSDLPEMRRIVENYNIGMIKDSDEKEKIKHMIKNILYNEAARKVWKEGLSRAASDLSWEKEKEKLKQIFIKAGLKFSY